MYEYSDVSAIPISQCQAAEELNTFVHRVVYTIYYAVSPVSSVFARVRPTELDALVYGHLFTLLTTHLPIKSLAHLVQSFPNLVEFCRRIDEDFFKETELPISS